MKCGLEMGRMGIREDASGGMVFCEGLSAGSWFIESSKRVNHVFDRYDLGGVRTISSVIAAN